MNGCGRTVLFEVGDLPLKLAWEPDIVGIEERHEPAAGVPDGFITRAPRTTVGLKKIYDAVAVVGNALCGVVRRGVVDDDDFEIAVGLSERRLERRDNGTACVTCGYENRNVRHTSLVVARGLRTSRSEWESPQRRGRLRRYLPVRDPQAMPDATLRQDSARGTNVRFLPCVP